MWAGRIVWILFQFDHIWVFALRAPSSNEVPVVLLNQPNVADAESCNEARATLFSRCRSPEALPPTSDAALLMKGSLPSNDMETSQPDKPYPSTSRDYELVEI